MSSLKNLSKRPMSMADIQAVARTLAHHTDREAAIVGAAMLETGLEEVFRAKFITLTATEDSEIFAGHAPLSTFSAKIAIAHALNMIGSDVRSDLATILKIRNTFAHARNSFTMQEHSITQACRSLRTRSYYAVGTALKKFDAISFAESKPWDGCLPKPDMNWSNPIVMFKGEPLDTLPIDYEADDWTTKKRFTHVTYMLWLTLFLMRGALAGTLE